MSNFVETAAELDDELIVDSDLFRGYDGRRLKAAITLSLCWLLTAFLHKVSWGHEFVWMVAGIMGIHAIRVMLAQPATAPQPLPSGLGAEAATTRFIDPLAAPLDRAPLDRTPLDRTPLGRVTPNGATPSEATLNGPTLDGAVARGWPYVSLLVAAKNEEKVIAGLVESLLNLDYPKDRYDIWLIDDNSSDRTLRIAEDFARRYPGVINVVHRGLEATGGKSGALNLVWPKTAGELLAVFDADAHVPTDLLRHVVPQFERPSIGAVQVRKAIANASLNGWTKGQRAEMALDSYMQARRIAVGGIGELRGNGQFVRRRAIAQCGGWNEETITDDLDLTVKLHLHRWDISLLFAPAVEEEGVTTAKALWHQRNRWAEGGFQRYLDYWRQLAKNRLGWGKSIDMLGFWIIQYMMPAVVLPDLCLALIRHQMPLFGPMTALGVVMSLWGMYSTLRRTEDLSRVQAGLLTLWGTVYMLHWVVVIATMTIRIAVRPKRLKWVKTVHGIA